MAQPNEQDIEKWYPRLFRTALRLTGAEADAADLTQQAFCQAFANWEQFSHKSLATTWLHRILVNCFVDWQRRQARRRVRPLDEWAINGLVDKAAAAPDQLGRQEQMEHMRLSIAQLPQAMRKAFTATVIDGYSYQQAAEMLDVSVGTIASQVNSARRQLRDKMTRIPGEVRP